MPKTDELVRLFRSVVSSRQELRDAGLGSLYDWTRKDRDNNISINLLRKFKEIYPDVELPFFYEKVANSELVPDVISEIESEGIEEEMYDVLNTETHLCVYGTILTHQCAEGNYTGGWTEKSRDRILWEARESKKYSAGYKMKPFSFNCNYVTDYKGMLWEFMKIYPKVTFINMRMEELGRDVDALRMMKLVGSNRISSSAMIV